MADKLGPLSDKTPRDASQMGSNSHTPTYVAVALAAIALVIVLYWSGMI